MVCHHVFSNDQFIHVEVLNHSGLLLSFLTVVYAKCSRIERRKLWDSLFYLRNTISDTPWIVGGNFNAISLLSEHAGRIQPDLVSIHDFADFIDRSALAELPLTSAGFTWSGM